MAEPILQLPSYSTSPTEPVDAEGTAAEYVEAGTTNPTTQAVMPPGAAPVGSSPELEWLASAEAEHYQGHWVALDPGTGSLVGLADTSETVRFWQQRGASIVFVAPADQWIGG